jgi:hypothetical protein
MRDQQAMHGSGNVGLRSPKESKFLQCSILVPTPNGELLSWYLGQDPRVVQQTTLMTIGLYSEPRSARPPIAV